MGNHVALGVFAYASACGTLGSRGKVHGTASRAA